MYENMTYEVILENMLENVKDDVDKREGSIIYDAISPVAYSLAKMYFELSNYSDLVFPDTAAGSYLDRAAISFNLTRKKASKAVKKGVFNKEVPLGSRFSTTGDIAMVYRVESEIGAENENYAYALVCETAGYAGNSYTGMLIPIDYINGLTCADLNGVITEGTNEETDEEFRTRLMAKIQRPSTSGNAQDYYNWALECTGVGAARVFPLANGPGTVSILITDSIKTAADQALVKNVWNHIEELRPIGANVTVASAIEKKIDISSRVKLEKDVDLRQVQQLYRQNVERYLSEQVFKITYLSLARIGNLLMEVSGVEDYDTLQIDGVMESMHIAENEIAVLNSVRLEVI